jgi:hypothetical protein
MSGHAARWDCRNLNTLAQPSAACPGRYETRAVLKKSVPGAIVPVEFVPLAEAFELSLSAVHLVSVRVLIIVAEQSEKRATETVREIYRSHRALDVEQTLIVHNDIAAQQSTIASTESKRQAHR